MFSCSAPESTDLKKTHACKKNIQITYIIGLDTLRLVAVKADQLQARHAKINFRPITGSFVAFKSL